MTLQLPWLDVDVIEFPPVTAALIEPNGLLAIGGDLSSERLLSAYRQGIFPWNGEDTPILWWSPNPRTILYPDRLKVSRSLQKSLRNIDWQIKYNTQFEQVMRQCQKVERKDQDGTWIDEDMVQAYLQLHHLGYAQSTEVYFENELVGGLYGILIGKVFFGESMFHHKRDASKVALVHLVEMLKKHDCQLIDCQVASEHLYTLGAEDIERTNFVGLLNKYTRAT